MATMKEKDLWDPDNGAQQKIMSFSEKKDLLNNERGVLIKIVRLDSELSAYLMQLKVISQSIKEALEVKPTNAAKVEELITHLERSPLWMLHAFFRALILAQQPHVIDLLELDTTVYEDQHASPKTEKSSKHFYRRADNDDKVPIPEIYMPAIVEYCRSLNLNIMHTPLFNFKNKDPIDLKKCFMDINALFKINQREWAEIQKHTLFRDFLDGLAPRTVQLEALPGEGKTTFLCEYAHTWSRDFIECHDNVSGECKGHDWMIVLYIAAGEMNTAELRTNVENSLKCKPKIKKIVVDYIFEDGDGVLLACDAADEIQNKKAREGLEIFVKQCKEYEGVKVLVAARSGLSFLAKSSFNRFLRLNGYSIEQGLAYFKKYFITIHGKAEEDAQEFVKANVDKIAFVLQNPLLNHIFSELAATGRLTKEELRNLTPVTVLKSLERYLVRRDSPEQIQNNEAHSLQLYKLCLECLLLGLREIPKDMLEKCGVVEESPYHAFMNKRIMSDKNAADITYHTFVHQVIFEYFAAAGLVHYLEDEDVPEVKKQAVLLTLCNDSQMRSLLELTCGFICQFKVDLAKFTKSVIEVSMILQHPGEELRENKDTRALLELSSQIKTAVQPLRGLLSARLAEDVSKKIGDTWTKIEQSFTEALRDAGWFCSLLKTKTSDMMQKDVKRVTDELVEHLKRGITTEKLQGLSLKVQQTVLDHGRILKELQGDMEKVLRPSDGSYDRAAPEASFPETILQFVQRADDLKSCRELLEPAGRYLMKHLRNTMEYESHLLSHLIRCLHQNTDRHQQREFYRETLNKLLPCHRIVNRDQLLHAYAVGDMRLALVSETTRDLHVYAACPQDMTEALVSHNPRSDRDNFMASLTFDVKSEFWEVANDQLEDEGIFSLLRQMNLQYGKFRALRVACGEDRVLSGFMKCMVTPGEENFLPRCLIFSGGKVHLDDLMTWLSDCPDTFLIWMDSLTIQLPKDKKTDNPQVDKDLRMAIPGLLTSPNYSCTT